MHVDDNSILFTPSNYSKLTPMRRGNAGQIQKQKVVSEGSESAFPMPQGVEAVYGHLPSEHSTSINDLHAQNVQIDEQLNKVSERLEQLQQKHPAINTSVRTIVANWMMQQIDALKRGNALDGYPEITESPHSISRTAPVDFASSFSLALMTGSQFIPPDQFIRCFDAALNEVIIGGEILELGAILGNGGLLIYRNSIINQAKAVAKELEKTIAALESQPAALKVETKEQAVEKLAHMRLYAGSLNEWIAKESNKLQSAVLSYTVKTATSLPLMIRCFWGTVAAISAPVSAIQSIFISFGSLIRSAYNLYTTGKSKQLHTRLTAAFEKMVYRKRFSDYYRDVAELSVAFAEKKQLFASKGIDLDKAGVYDDHGLVDLLEEQNAEKYKQLERDYLFYTQQEHAFGEIQPRYREKYRTELETLLDHFLKDKADFGEVEEALLAKGVNLNSLQIDTIEALNAARTNPINFGRIVKAYAVARVQASRILARQGLKTLIKAKAVQEKKIFTFMHNKAKVEFTLTLGLAAAGIALQIAALAGVALSTAALASTGIGMAVLGALGILVGLYYLRKKKPHLFNSYYTTSYIRLSFLKLKRSFYEYRLRSKAVQRDLNSLKLEKILVEKQEAEAVGEADWQASLERENAAINDKIQSLQQKLKDLEEKINPLQDVVHAASVSDFTKAAKVATTWKAETIQLMDTLVDNLFEGGGAFDQETKDFFKSTFNFSIDQVPLKDQADLQQKIRRNLHAFFATSDHEYLEMLKNDAQVN